MQLRSFRRRPMNQTRRGFLAMLTGGVAAVSCGMTKLGDGPEEPPESAYIPTATDIERWYRDGAEAAMRRADYRRIEKRHYIYPQGSKA